MKKGGFTLLEMLITLAIASLVMLGLGRVVGQALQTREAMLGRQELTREAQFAMSRMTRAVRGAEQLFIPQNDNAATAWDESVRNVLALSLDPEVDRDEDGKADADNDGDELVDEDTNGDKYNNGVPGISGIDDDGDGFVDESDGIVPANDDDENNNDSDDWIDGLDTDNDGSVDEDLHQDMNKDFAPGIAGVDDDGDGSIDEGHFADDDEDGLNNEDWFDPVVFFLSGTTLLERTPVVWDENSDATIDGLDFVENPLADNVSQFRVERVSVGSKKNILVDISLTLAAGNDTITLQSRTRMRGKQ
jgi:prepilin-type N-terminal cleavage/methylation domain-containing protein